MKPYSDDFKANIAKIYHDERRSKQFLANEYGVHSRTVSHWMKQSQPIKLPEGMMNATAFKGLQKSNQQLKLIQH